MKIYCHNCHVNTEHYESPYDPDSPDGGSVWQCSICGEANDIVDGSFDSALSAASRASAIIGKERAMQVVDEVLFPRAEGRPEYNVNIETY